MDFSKAFDKINYWKLFNMLLDDGISVKMVQLLAFWYSHQVMCIKWNGVTSGCFTIANGTRQGGVLSPYLFNCYIEVRYTVLPDLLPGVTLVTYR